MEKIASRKELLERLTDLKYVELKAKTLYRGDLITFSNFKILETVAQIERDEERHIHMIDELIDMLNKPFKKG